jgi:hypothetical protein
MVRGEAATPGAGGAPKWASKHVNKPIKGQVLSCGACQPAACTPHVNFVLHNTGECSYANIDYVHYWEVGALTGLAAPGTRHPRYATDIGLQSPSNVDSILILRTASTLVERWSTRPNSDAS